MKKLALLLGSLLVVGTSVQAKEVVTVVSVVEEVIVEEVILVPVEEAKETPWGYVNLRAGWDFTSRYNTFSDSENGESYDFLTNKTKGFGGEVAVEAYKTLDNFDLGLGVAYQKHMKRKALNYSYLGEEPGSEKGAEFTSVPLYVTAKYNMNYCSCPMIPYIKANLGYSFNFNSKDDKWNTEDGSYTWDAKTNDGLYWAAGMGVQYENFNVDVLYGVNKAKTKLTDGSGNSEQYKNNYSRVTLSVGYRFDI